MTGSSALLTDLYQLTMAQGWWRSGLARREGAYHLYFRENPFGGSWALACGLESAAAFIEGFRFAEGDLSYLAGLPGSDGQPLFEPGFLAFLRALRLSVDVDAMREGTLLSAPEPLLMVRGTLIECQLLETALLNLLNFQTLIATKAARIVLAARGAPVLEFGLRRAQGPDGGVSASRAAYVGGCAATSNLLAGKRFGIPVRGTHAHSWVMSFEDELEAFEANAHASSGDCVFLVDTYDTLEGVRRAVEVGRRLRSAGRRLAGIRLDSGDLAELSREARRILDEAGFEDALISATDDLDEHRIAELLERGARIDVWGVGTRLVTGHGQPALGGVFKLSALREPGGPWRDVVKAAGGGRKASYPGLLQVRRLAGGNDVIYDLRRPPDEPGEDLLVPVFRGGRRVLPAESVEEARARARAQRGSPPRVSLEPGYAERREALLESKRGAPANR
ncbi:MAG TPA: nicotinate phosphoribosyltransferase [Elusimicrobia bacterium]|nr:nicotinate phosphoribosyltransferase [Elusimicrobiota bacterium]